MQNEQNTHLYQKEINYSNREDKDGAAWKKKEKKHSEANESRTDDDKFSATMDRAHTKLHAGTINTPKISEAKQLTFPLLLDDRMPSTYWPPL